MVLSDESFVLLSHKLVLHDGRSAARFIKAESFFFFFSGYG